MIRSIETNSKRETKVITSVCTSCRFAVVLLVLVGLQQQYSAKESKTQSPAYPRSSEEGLVKPRIAEQVITVRNLGGNLKSGDTILIV